MSHLQNGISCRCSTAQLHSSGKQPGIHGSFREHNRQWSRFGGAADSDGHGVGNSGTEVGGRTAECDSGRLSRTVDRSIKIEKRRATNGFEHIQSSTSDGLSGQGRSGHGTAEQCQTNGCCGNTTGLSRGIQGRRTCDVRSCHGGAAVVGISRSRHGGNNRRSWCTDINRSGSIAGEAGDCAGTGDRGHGNHGIIGGRGLSGCAHCRVVIRRVGCSCIVVRGSITGSRDEQNVLFRRTNNGVVQRLGVSPATPRIVGGNQIDAVPSLEVGEVVQCLDGVQSRSASWAEELAGDH